MAFPSTWSIFPSTRTASPSPGSASGSGGSGSCRQETVRRNRLPPRVSSWRHLALRRPQARSRHKYSYCGSNIEHEGGGAMPRLLCHWRSSLRLRQRLIEVGHQVAGGLQTDRQAHIVGSDARGGLGVLVELGVGGRRRMNHQRLRIADIGQVPEELNVLDEPSPGLESALDAETEDGTEQPVAVVLRRSL